jgi:FkbM family methyltransferase
MIIDYDEQCEYIEFRGRRWKWPKKDDKLKAVNDWVTDLNTAILELVKMERELKVAVQAGGACGVWPDALQRMGFDVVLTYEPDKLNFWCLAANVSNNPINIHPQNLALGERSGKVVTALHPSEKNNVGAYFTTDSDSAEAVERIRLDDVPMYACDLICLDIEGREVEALRGAHYVIERYQPVIMIEEKPLPHMGPGRLVNHQPGEATEWLQKIHGYQIAHKVHRDLILVPPKE